MAFVLAIVTSNGSRSSGSTGGNASGNQGSSDISSVFGDLGNQLASNEALAQGMKIAAAVIILVLVICMVIGIVLDIFVFNPLEIGCQRFFIENSYSDQASPKLMGWAFKKGYYSNTLMTMLLRDLYVFLWALLFVIPGIVKAYEYRMIPYLLAENPCMTREEAFRRSKQMMTGEKWNAFVLDLSFIGWHILSLFTLGILGIFYVSPYQSATNAELYNVLKRS